MNRYFKSFLLLLIFLNYSCKKVFQYSPNEVRPDVKNINTQNIAKIVATGDTLRIIVISDIHHAYEELQGCVEEFNKMEGISFVILAGDLTNFGLQYEYDKVHELLSGLTVPYISVIGNHDHLSNGSKIFNYMYGPLNFSFRVKDNKFIFINTCSREYNYNGTVPDLGFLASELADSASYTNAFVIGHVPSYDIDFDSNLEQDFKTKLTSGKVKASIFGHIHAFDTINHYQNKFQALVCDDLKDRKYILLKIYGSTLLFQEKPF